jgi:coproporphyrinogen III oxidase-like Fe-S oxidoreductase
MTENQRSSIGLLLENDELEITLEANPEDITSEYVE